MIIKRRVRPAIVRRAGQSGAWRWLNAGEVTADGDVWDFGPETAVQSYSWEPAEPGYTVMGDEETDVMRRVEDEP